MTWRELSARIGGLGFLVVVDLADHLVQVGEDLLVHLRDPGLALAAATSQRDNGDTTERGRSPGLGLYHPGEGIFGLRRAFEIAVARSVLVTI
jgi:hypothetical protein